MIDTLNKTNSRKPEHQKEIDRVLGVTKRRRTGATLLAAAGFAGIATGVAAVEGHNIRAEYALRVEKAHPGAHVDTSVHTDHNELSATGFGADVLVGARSLIDRFQGKDPFKDPYLTNDSGVLGNIDPAALPEISKR